MNILEWFNGKKTVIGSALLFLAVFGNEVLAGLWEFNPSWLTPAIKTCSWFGMLFGGVGLTHKAVKSSQ